MRTTLGEAVARYTENAPRGEFVVVVEGAQQAPDHPILWNVPETDYLKFFTFQIV